MKTLTIAVVTCLLATTSWAKSTICTVDSGSTGIKAIAWDDERKVAKITDFAGDIYDGVIALTRDHGQDGEKINLVFDYKKSILGDDIAEFIVFPIGKDQYRVIGVTYIVRGGQRHLSTSMGNYPAKCLSM